MTYLAFTEIADTGKTKVWKVWNENDGSYLGLVKWHGPWRKYVLFMESNCIWSQDCLEDVARFINTEMEKRKSNARSK